MSRPLVDLTGIRAQWRRAAEKLGARYVNRAGYYGYPMLSVPVDDTAVLLEVRNTEQGVWTRAAMPFHDPEKVVLGVTAEGVVTRFLKALGLVQDLELGHPAFDRRFRVKANSEATAREVLADPLPELMLAQPMSARLRVVPRWTENLRLPDHIALVELMRTGSVGAFEELQTMVDLVATVGRRLDPITSDAATDGDEVVRRIRVLQRAGGDLVDRLSGTVAWDFDPARAAAAQELGELGDTRAVPVLVGVLGDPDDRVVIAAIQALRALGSSAGAPEYARLLGRRKVQSGRSSVAAAAAAALREVGRGAVVDAFERALKGEPHALVVRVEDFRDEVVEALLGVVESFDLDARAEAARALGHLGAREAIPLLRKHSHAMGMKTKFAEACREALRRIEAQASLPRAAEPGGPVASDTLPRPADGATNPGTDTLPRPQEPEGD